MPTIRSHETITRTLCGASNSVFRSRSRNALRFLGLLSTVVWGAGCTARPPQPSEQPPTPASPSPSEAVRPQSSPSLATLEAEAKAHPDDAKAHARYGSALVEAGKVPEGIAHLRRAVARDPKLTPAWHNLGLACESVGWLDLSAEAYRRVVSAKPEHTGEWVKLGYALLPLGRYEEAEKAFRQAATLQPDASEPLVALASSYYASFHYEEAISALKRAAALNPRSVAAQANLASIQQELGKRGEAEAAIRASLRMEPESPRHLLVLGRILYDAPQPEKRKEAQEALERMLSASNGNDVKATASAEANYLLGQIAKNNGQREQALTFLRRAYTLDPRHTMTMRVLGQMLVRQGGSEAVEGQKLLRDYAEAMALRDRERKMSQAVETHPNEGATRLEYGKLLLAQGNLPRAVWELREAVRLLPKDVEAKKILADAFRRQGREEEADSLSH